MSKNYIRRKSEQRRRLIFGLALVLAMIVSICLLPALLVLAFGAPKLAACGVLAAAFPLGVMRTGKHEEEMDEQEFQSTVLKGVRALRSEMDEMKGHINTQSVQLIEARRARIASLVRPQPGSVRSGLVSDECAKGLACTIISNCANKGMLEALLPEPRMREAMLAQVKSFSDDLGIQTKAETTSEIPLPTSYSGELVELISKFGVLRKAMMPYPLSGGIQRPPRMGTRPAFGSIAMSATFPEKKPTITFASLEPHKIGGIVILPREIEDQSIVKMGQYLARYGAIEFARAEDTWGFLADGTSTYESIKGIVQIAIDNSQTVTLASTKTHPSDATLADLRALRTKVNKAALSGKMSAYYMDTTWETTLRTFNSTSDLYAYVRLPDGSAMLDGYPIVWTDVLQPFTTSAAAGKPIVVFGALEFWWFGERGTPRIDTSEHVYFVNDQLATRFIEEIDFDYSAVDAASALFTAAS